MVDKIFNYNGDQYRVISVGRTKEDGMVYLHLASTTKGRMQKNGFHPIQLCGFFTIDGEILLD